MFLYKLLTIISLNIFLVNSIYFRCKMSTNPSGTECSCFATGGKKPVASGGFADLTCTFQYNYCSSSQKGLPNGRVKIEYCDSNKMRLSVEKFNVKKVYVIEKWNITVENGVEIKNKNLNTFNEE
ncbi:hypothetical protein K502DRAFT_136457 [Neoconidiobolus thromboides FSU 785]|nr:hypothetical protein K502DRAFT_136457 [Neoconidiobolus thromboides FSU 785]